MHPSWTNSTDTYLHYLHVSNRRNEREAHGVSRADNTKHWLRWYPLATTICTNVLATCIYIDAAVRVCSWWLHQNWHTLTPQHIGRRQAKSGSVNGVVERRREVEGRRTSVGSQHCWPVSHISCQQWDESSLSRYALSNMPNACWKTRSTFLTLVRHNEQSTEKKTSIRSVQEFLLEAGREDSQRSSIRNALYLPDSIPRAIPSATRTGPSQRQWLFAKDWMPFAPTLSAHARE